MATYDTQHFTPTSTEDSAYAWDRLADLVIGHEGSTTTSDALDAAFALLNDGDVRLLQGILSHVPALHTDHLGRAANRAAASRTMPRV